LFVGHSSNGSSFILVTAALRNAEGFIPFALVPQLSSECLASGD